MKLNFQINIFLNSFKIQKFRTVYKWFEYIIINFKVKHEVNNFYSQRNEKIHPVPIVELLRVHSRLINPGNQLRSFLRAFVWFPYLVLLLFYTFFNCIIRYIIFIM